MRPPERCNRSSVPWAMPDTQMRIPNAAHWPVTQLGDVCALISRGTAPVYVERSDVMAIGQRCVTVAGFDAGKARPHSHRAMRGVVEPACGDVLLNSTGTGTIGRSCVFRHKGQFVLDGHVTVLRPNQARLDGRWLNAILRSVWGQSHLERFCFSGSTNQVELNRVPLATTGLPLPPVHEQRLAAKVLDTLDTTIRQTEAIIEKLKQVKQGLLHDLLTRGIDDNGELRPPQSEAPHLYKESALGWIPWKWSTPSIAEIKAELIDGDRGANYPGADDYRHEGFCVFLSAQNVTSEGFRFYTVQFIDETRHRLLRNGAMNRGDIAVTTRGTLGNVGHFDGAVPFDVVRINSGMAIIRSHDDRLSNSFLYEYLRSQSGQRQFEVGSYGSAQPQLNLDILRNLRLALPSITEQDGIQKHALTAQTLISNEGDALNKLRLLKSGLMDDLLTGRVRVTSLLNAET